MLGTPPAFILSQDQTLVKSVCIQFRIAWQFCSCLLFLGWHLNVCSEFLLEFSGCCLLFSYQSSLFLSQRQLIYNIISISLCQQFFYFLFFCISFSKAFLYYHGSVLLSTIFLHFFHFIFLRINTAIVLHLFTFNKYKVSTFQKAKKAETCAFQKCTVLSFLI